MTRYWIIILLPTVMTVFKDYIKESTKYILYLFILFLLIVFVGLRDNVGGDWVIYYAYLQEFGPNSSTRTFEEILNADLIFLQNPNVPYGNSYSEDEIRNICSITDKIIALDDVYFGFNVPDYLPLIDEYNNLVIMRSFSKAFGLASIRLGYIMSQEHNIKYISNNRNGYETNLLSLQTAHYFINHEEIKDEYQEYFTFNFSPMNVGL